MVSARCFIYGRSSQARERGKRALTGNIWTLLQSQMPFLEYASSFSFPITSSFVGAMAVRTLPANSKVVGSLLVGAECKIGPVFQISHQTVGCEGKRGAQGESWLASGSQEAGLNQRSQPLDVKATKFETLFAHIGGVRKDDEPFELGGGFGGHWCCC
jgi:hypothetical protein